MGTAALGDRWGWEGTPVYTDTHIQREAAARAWPGPQSKSRRSRQRFSLRAGLDVASSSCFTSAGGCRPLAAARSHRCSRVIPRHGPYRMSKSKARSRSSVRSSVQGGRVSAKGPPSCACPAAPPTGSVGRGSCGRGGLGALLGGGAGRAGRCGHGLTCVRGQWPRPRRRLATQRAHRRLALPVRPQVSRHACGSAPSRRNTMWRSEAEEDASRRFDS